MTETERKLLIHLANWLIRHADPKGEGAIEAQRLISRILAEGPPWLIEQPDTNE
jgi:hypothetical protein